MPRAQRIRFLAISACIAMAGSAFAGVAQVRSVYNANSAYATGGTVAVVNPNYNGTATVYRGQNAAVAVGPNGVAAVGPNGNVVYNGSNTTAVTGYYGNYGGYAAGYTTGYGTPAPPAGTANLSIGMVVQDVPSTAVPVRASDSNTYYYDNNAFFVQVYDGGDVAFQVVMAPLGAVVTMLPAGCSVQYYNNQPFQQCGNTFYRQVAGGYEVAAVN